MFEKFFSIFKKTNRMSIPRDINLGFWSTIKKPIVVLAPMADVTDSAFRKLIAECGAPDVTWTEFVSADGLMLGGFERLKNDLKYSEKERPIVAQLFTSKPENMEKASRLCAELGFDGIDINMGCPDRAIEKQGCGSAMIKNPKLAIEIIKSVKRGAPDLPISVKTRLGYNKDILEEWLPILLSAGPAVITVHARTRKEMSKVPARWERVKRSVEIRNELGAKTLIFGNGDIKDPEEAFRKAKETGADGVMIGRGIFGTPTLFANLKERKDAFLSGKVLDIQKPSIAEQLHLLEKHVRYFEELLTGHKAFHVMKKHFKAYVNGFDGAKELREKLMEAENAEEVSKIIAEYQSPDTEYL